MREMSTPEDALGKVVLQTTDVSGRAVRKLLNLVNSLLDISKLESGLIALDREPTALKTVIQHTLDELTPLAEQMEVQLFNEVAEEKPLLDIDTDKIERVMYNLVDNAIKFTPVNGKAYVRAGVKTAPQGFICVEVCDTGPGIPNEYKQTLFNRYEQVRERRGRRRGTGLGLTFCKLAVEAHGGKIWIEDNPAGGSIFAFTLPIFSEPGEAPTE
jgi:signal transduction histidine kinase